VILTHYLSFYPTDWGFHLDVVLIFLDIMRPFVVGLAPHNKILLLTFILLVSLQCMNYYDFCYFESCYWQHSLEGSFEWFLPSLRTNKMSVWCYWYFENISRTFTTSYVVQLLWIFFYFITWYFLFTLCAMCWVKNDEQTRLLILIIRNLAF
jgi:hypothetical protein